MDASAILLIIVVLVVIGVYLFSRNRSAIGGTGEVKRSHTSTEANPRMGGLESDPTSQYSEFRTPVANDPTPPDDKNFRTKGSLDA
jgi:hypothetical protein